MDSRSRPSRLVTAATDGYRILETAKGIVDDHLFYEDGTEYQMYTVRFMMDMIGAMASEDDSGYNGVHQVHVLKLIAMLNAIVSQQCERFIMDHVALPMLDPQQQDFRATIFVEHAMAASFAVYAATYAEQFIEHRELHPGQRSAVCLHEVALSLTREHIEAIWKDTLEDMASFTPEEYKEWQKGYAITLQKVADVNSGRSGPGTSSRLH